MCREESVEQVRRRYEDLLAEVREVAARVRERVEELRVRFPEARLPGGGRRSGGRPAMAGPPARRPGDGP